MIGNCCLDPLWKQRSPEAPGLGGQGHSVGYDFLEQLVTGMFSSHWEPFFSAEQSMERLSSRLRISISELESQAGQPPGWARELCAQEGSALECNAP